MVCCERDTRVERMWVVTAEEGPLRRTSSPSLPSFLPPPPFLPLPSSLSSSFLLLTLPYFSLRPHPNPRPMDSKTHNAAFYIPRRRTGHENLFGAIIPLILLLDFGRFANVPTK